MRPSDPRLRRQLAPARRQLAGRPGRPASSAAWSSRQAWAVTGLVVAVLDDGDVAGRRPWRSPAVLVARGRGRRGLSDLARGPRPRPSSGTSLRRRLVAAAVASGDAGRPDRRASSVLATRGVAAAEPYLTRYLPALVLAVRAAAPDRRRDRHAGPAQRRDRAVHPARSCPSSAPSSASPPGTGPREQWRAMASLSGHFVDVMRGLPTLVAYRRARAQSGTDRARHRPLPPCLAGTLRIAFASSAVLELVATLSVALVAVTVGVRLAPATLDLHTALVVLLLAPEAYWPLRRVGAEFHAAAEGVATFEAAERRCSQTPTRRRRRRRRPRRAPTACSTRRHRHLRRAAPCRRWPLDAVLPARGVTVVTGPSRLRQVDPPGGPRRPAPAHRRRGAPRAAAASAGRLAGQVAWLPQRPRLRARHASPTTSGWPPRRRTTTRCGRPCAGWRSRSGSAPCPAASTTPLGEDGTTLSAGERARLALARIVLADRPWVLLDEPTAHLDDLTEQVIADTIVELGRRGAVVVVAHRPALVALADQRARRCRRRRRSRGRPRAADRDRPTSRPATAARRGRRPAGGRGSGCSTLVGALASASGVALTATAGWLIVQASTQPGVLTLLVGHRRRAHLRPRPSRCCGTSSGCARTTRRSGCWPVAGSRSTTPSCHCPGAARPPPRRRPGLDRRRRRQRRRPRAAGQDAGTLVRDRRRAGHGRREPAPAARRDWSSA